ncbi:hypothetical protein BD309DRAFT_554006 [Dichomitus squalens]|uniref:Uncharacterized protein n=1 Tax=Dichomitus squalens TaxID=114155 RepID=A0A4Q9NFB3_9APHY|nr:hypothetical protein BD311DRAFT_528884 [Dichomitus squalens]TBU38111.1 hypothetical protein BD309DRAFT_554006 [Dichomitus squalens]
MSRDISVHFLGTTSGGGPTETRNCSSLVVDMFGNGQLWMIDCAEGTRRQFEQQPYRPGQQRLRMTDVTKIFITHLHGERSYLRSFVGVPLRAPCLTAYTAGSVRHGRAGCVQLSCVGLSWRTARFWNENLGRAAAPNTPVRKVRERT